MSLLPELDRNGFIIEPKKKAPVMKSIQSEKKKYALDWSLLLQDRCPSCGEFWFLDKKEDAWLCRNHQKLFFIRAFKVAKIKKDLQRREEMNPRIYE